MSNRHYIACRHVVSEQHASPPIAFLDQLIDAIDPLPDSVFAENERHDIYAVMKGSLGPYSSLLHRKAVMCEALRVVAAFESDWNWNEGVDVNNHHSTTHPEGEETGAFQVSFDSTALGDSAMLPFAKKHKIDSPLKFIAAMKDDHRLAVEYCARLLRIDTSWCGTLNNPKQTISHVRRDAVAEFQTFLEVGNEPGSLAATNAKPKLTSLGSGGALAVAGPAEKPSDGHGTSNPHSKPNISKFIESPFQSSRNGATIRKIVLHCTEGSLEGTVREFTENRARQVSAHYVIDRDGAIIQMVRDSDRAHHAKGANKDSIGIEHVGSETDALAEKQQEASAALIRWLIEQYDIPRTEIYGHDFAPDYDQSNGGTSCPDRLFGHSHSQATIRAWVEQFV